MKNFSSLFLLSFFVLMTSAWRIFAEPVITLAPVSPGVICASGNSDTVSYSVSASGIPANTNIVIYQSTDSAFNPNSQQGDSIGFIPGNAIPQDTVNFGTCVKTLGIFIDACGAAGQEGRNEYIILTSGSGIKVSNLGIDFSSQNNNGATNADINTGANPCGYKTPGAALISSLQVGSCNTSNVIPASPTDSIPANAIILLFTSDSVSAGYSINGLCNLGYPIYIIQSACVRTIGAFTNAPRCDAPSRYRTTTAIDKRQNCRDNFTYDLCAIFDEDGTYAIRQQGTDTASVANNGIRRNAIDSCGGIDYAQLNFSADTTLKFKIPTAFCNTGYHFLKAVLQPNTQPVTLSNTISFKYVCNDVSVTPRTTAICSGDSAYVAISGTDPNAAFSWTVSGGVNITGEAAGSGTLIKQQLTNTSAAADSVTYIVTSLDAGCAVSKTVTIKVQPQVSPVISGNLIICNNGSVTLSVSGQYDSLRWNTNQTANAIVANQAGTYSVTAFKNGCSGTASVNVSGTSLDLSISGNEELCNDNTVTLVANGTYDSVRWNTGASGSELVVSTAGDYTATGYLNGCSDAATVRVTQCQQECTPAISGNIPFCQGDSVTLDAGSGFTSYSWNTGAATQTIKVKAAGKYVVTVTAENCVGKDSVVVTVNALPEVSVSGNTSICTDARTTLTANADADSLRWNTNETTAEITVSQPQAYTVTVYKNGCSRSATVQVSVLNPPLPFSLGVDTAFCGTFSKVISTGNQSTSWNTDETGPQITVTEAGEYIATVTNDCGSVSDTIVISQSDLPQVFIGNDTAFCEGEILLTVSEEFRSVVWNTGAETSSISVREEGVYAVEVTDGNGCRGSDSIDIRSNCANDIWVPNAFSPNGDGINDVFLVRGNPVNTTVEKLSVYNRWGNKVFEATDILPDDPLKGWDGKYKGDSAPSEVYGYYVVARFRNGEKKTIKGNVTLLK